MELHLKIQFIAAIAGILAYQTSRAEPDFYEQFTSLIDTNRFGPPLTNSTLSLDKLKQSGEIAGVKLGTSMSSAVQHWGKPRTFFSSCGGGPLLSFAHGALNFRGDKVVRLAIYPNTIPGISFDSGLTATNTPAQFAKRLGLPAPGPVHWYLRLESETGLMELRWQHYAVGGWQLCTLSFEARGLRETEVPDKPL